MRNLRKCIDRIFRKIVARLENQKEEESTSKTDSEATVDEQAVASQSTVPTVYEKESP